MTHRRKALQLSTIWSMALAAWVAGPAAGKSPQECRLLADAVARLACYDALVDQGAFPASAPAPSGFSQRPAPPAATVVESRIPGRFQGWSAGSRIALANGQVWEVIDGSWLRGEWYNPRVVVRPKPFGGYRLEIEGLNRSVDVSRLR